MASLREQKATIVMAHGISLTGSVTDPQGKGIAGAVVVWGDDPYSQTGSHQEHRQQVLTDANGVYRLPPSPPMTMTVTVIAEGWMPSLKKVTITRENPKVDFPLKRGNTLRVRFVDSSDKPIPGVGVGIERWRGCKSLYNVKHPIVLETHIPTQAGKDGVYEWTWAPDDEVQYRFYKEGYRTITSKPLVAGGAEHTITLTPDRQQPRTVNPPKADDRDTRPAMRGRVLDHAGKPVEGARVFLRKPGESIERYGQMLYSAVGRDAVLTDADGRFLVAGGGKDAEHIGVLAPQLDAWIVPAPKEGVKEELTIRLPRPATLKVIVDIPGAVQHNEQVLVYQPRLSMKPAGKDVWIELDLKTWDMEGWKKVGTFRQMHAVANPGELVIENLTPGKYDFWRTKFSLLGGGAFCDRQDVTLLPGETKVVRLVRKRGQRVDGEVRGLPEEIPGAFITVRPPQVTGDPGNPDDPKTRDEWKLPTYDAVACLGNGKFLTGLLEPGQYKIVAWAYRPEPNNGVVDTSWRLPEYVGTALVTIEDDDPLAPKKPRPSVTLDMKPRNKPD